MEIRHPAQVTVLGVVYLTTSGEATGKVCLDSSVIANRFGIVMCQILLKAQKGKGPSTSLPGPIILRLHLNALL